LNKLIASTGATADPTIKKIQKLLGVTIDGFWGPESQGALNALGGADSKEPDSTGFGEVLVRTASSFADPADVKSFIACKKTGKTDQQCFLVGDNGVGAFGKLTAQDVTPMVALHREDMKAKFGSTTAAAHRKVRVTIGGLSVVAFIEDILGVKGRVDLNPAAAKALKLSPPFLVKNAKVSFV